MLNITDEYVYEKKTTQNIDDENQIFIVTIKILLFSITGGVILLSVIGLIRWNALKPLFS